VPFQRVVTTTMGMMMWMAGLGVVTALELKEPILHWTQFLACTPFVKSL